MVEHIISSAFDVFGGSQVALAMLLGIPFLDGALLA